MKKLLVLLALALLPTVALAAPSISFDTVPGGAGGTVTYDGAGGAAIGLNIKFVDIAGTDTPLNAGDVLACVDCFLSFTTGTNTQEGPNQWIWNGGGSFVLIGDVPSLGLDNAVLVSGSFLGTPQTPGLASGDLGAIFLGVGIDSKNEVLAAHYGLGPDDWRFGNTEIALGTFTPGADGAFTAIPNQADLINTPVPEPGTWLLVGTGLLGFVPILTRRRRD